MCSLSSATSDYTAISQYTLEFSSSQLSVLVNVYITDDLVLEDLLECFQANLILDRPFLVSNPGAITTGPELANITIRDNDGKITDFCKWEYRNCTHDVILW